jgi:hypothetical protein
MKTMRFLVSTAVLLFLIGASLGCAKKRLGTVPRRLDDIVEQELSKETLGEVPVLTNKQIKAWKKEAGPQYTKIMGDCRTCHLAPAKKERRVKIYLRGGEQIF